MTKLSRKDIVSDIEDHFGCMNGQSYEEIAKLQVQKAKEKCGMCIRFDACRYNVLKPQFFYKSDEWVHHMETDLHKAAYAFHEETSMIPAIAERAMPDSELATSEKNYPVNPSYQHISSDSSIMSTSTISSEELQQEYKLKTYAPLSSKHANRSSFKPIQDEVADQFKLANEAYKSSPNLSMREQGQSLAKMRKQMERIRKKKYSRKLLTLEKKCNIKFPDVCTRKQWLDTIVNSSITNCKFKELVNMNVLTSVVVCYNNNIILLFMIVVAIRRGLS